MPRGLLHRASDESEQGLEKFLGGLELAVMEIVWEKEPITVRDVLDSLRTQGRGLAYTTVMTIMGRLAEKGWLRADKQSRTYQYRAVRSREEARAESVGTVMRVLLQDFGALAVSQFVKEVNRTDPAQLARLAQLAQQATDEQAPAEDTR